MVRKSCAWRESERCFFLRLRKSLLLHSLRKSLLIISFRQSCELIEKVASGEKVRVDSSWVWEKVASGEKVREVSSWVWEKVYTYLVWQKVCSSWILEKVASGKKNLRVERKWELFLPEIEKKLTFP